MKSKNKIIKFTVLLVVSLLITAGAGSDAVGRTTQSSSKLSPRIMLSAPLMEQMFSGQEPLPRYLINNGNCSAEYPLVRKLVLYQCPFGKPLDKKVIDHIRRTRPDFVILPEYFFMSSLIKKLDESRKEDILETGWHLSTLYMAQFKKLSRDLSITLISGSLIEKAGKTFYNTCYVFSCGRLVGKHRKLLLNETEKRMGFSPGNNIGVFSIQGVRFGVILSDDIFLPELSRILEMSGEMDMLFMPFSSPVIHRRDAAVFASKRSVLKWLRKSKTYLVKVGGVSELFGQARRGKTRIFGPEGILARASNDYREEVINVELDIGRLRQVREEQREKTISAVKDLTPLEFVRRSIGDKETLHGDRLKVYKKDTENSRAEFLRHLICCILDRYFRCQGSYRTVHVSPPLFAEEKSYYQFSLPSGAFSKEEEEIFLSAFKGIGIRIEDDFTLNLPAVYPGEGTFRVADFSRVRIDNPRLKAWVKTNSSELKTVLNRKSYGILIKALHMSENLKADKNEEFAFLQEEYLHTIFWWSLLNTHMEDDSLRFKINQEKDSDQLTGRGI